MHPLAAIARIGGVELPTGPLRKCAPYHKALIPDRARWRIAEDDICAQAADRVEREGHCGRRPDPAPAGPSSSASRSRWPSVRSAKRTSSPRPRAGATARLPMLATSEKTSRQRATPLRPSFGTLALAAGRQHRVGEPACRIAERRTVHGCDEMGLHQGRSRRVACRRTSHWDARHATSRRTASTARCLQPGRACANQAERSFGSHRRMIERRHHHVFPQHLYGYANHAVRLEDHIFMTADRS